MLHLKQTWVLTCIFWAQCPFFDFLDLVTLREKKKCPCLWERKGSGKCHSFLGTPVRAVSLLSSKPFPSLSHELSEVPALSSFPRVVLQLFLCCFPGTTQQGRHCLQSPEQALPFWSSLWLSWSQVWRPTDEGRSCPLKATARQRRDDPFFRTPAAVLTRSTRCDVCRGCLGSSLCQFPLGRRRKRRPSSTGPLSARGAWPRHPPAS